MQGIGLGLLLGLCAVSIRAQETPQLNETTNPAITETAVSSTELSSASPATEAMREPIDDEDFEPVLALGFIADHRRPVNGDYKHISQGFLVGEGDVGRFTSVGVTLGGGSMEFENGSNADLLSHSAFFGEVCLMAKQYFAPQHAFLRPYITAGVGCLLMAWEYRTPIGTEPIEVDTMIGFDGYAGAGLYVGLRKHWRLFAEMNTGVVALEGRTDRGVKNTMFDNFTYVGVKAGLCIAF